MSNPTKPIKVTYLGVKTGKEIARPYKDVWHVRYRYFRVCRPDAIFGEAIAFYGIPLKSSVRIRALI